MERADEPRLRLEERAAGEDAPFTGARRDFLEEDFLERVMGMAKSL